jgi:hypothetical protein
VPPLRSELKRSGVLFLLCLIASALSLVFIGFPGICGFTGKYGDAISRTTTGFWIALGLFLLPILGIVITGIWWIGSVFLRSRSRKGEPFH